MLGPSEYKMKMHIGEFFAQDKWQMKPGLTLSAGVRYDIEVFPYEQDPGNPLFQGRSPAVSRSTRTTSLRVWVSCGIPTARASRSSGSATGMFYDRTLLGTVDNFLTDLKYAESFVANFPQAGADTGPRNGRFPTDPTLNSGDVSRLTPAVRSYINSVYPPGTTVRNSATVTWDDPNRAQPYFHQFSAGYEREVFTGVSASVDYIRMSGR